MKKFLLSVISIVFIVGIIIIFSCKKPENTPPFITLKGGAEMEVVINNAFVDPGAEATDEEDGNISHLIVVGGDVVDTGRLGVYIITYSVTDADGASASKERRVQVIMAQNKFIAQWAAVDSVLSGVGQGNIYNNVVNITANTLDSSKVDIYDFRTFGDSCKISLTFKKGGTLVIPAQTIIGSTNNTYQGTVFGDGKMNSDAKGFELNYTIEFTAPTAGTSVCKGVYTKQ